MTESSFAQSVKARLLNRADGNNKRYQQLVVRYIHERFLYRLSKSIYRERFLLKGGSLLYAYQEFTPRPTLDIDFMGTRIDNDKENIKEVFGAVASMEFPEDGITFVKESIEAGDITVEKRYPGVRITMMATLGTYRQKLTMDIGFGDIIVPHPMELEYPVIFDQMEAPSILTYSLETVVAEKFQTMIERGRLNSRMKDYFDLYRIFSAYTFDSEILEEAIKATFDNRNTPFQADTDFFSEDFANDPMLSRRWDSYIRKLNLELPHFPGIHAFITSTLLPYWTNVGKQ